MEVSFVRVSHSAFLHECLTRIAKLCSSLTYSKKATGQFQLHFIYGPHIKSCHATLWFVEFQYQFHVTQCSK